jgi:hypothetical protein
MAIGDHTRPIHADFGAKLIAAIVRGRRWLNEFTASADASTEQIAVRERCSLRKVNMTLSLAILPPDLVKAAIEGRFSHGRSTVALWPPIPARRAGGFIAAYARTRFGPQTTKRRS